MTKDTIRSKIWFEEPEEDNPYAAKACYCSGYDVYGDLLGQVSWIEYLYLLFKLELPSESQKRLLEVLAVALANPGIRDHSVRAAMNAGACGSTKAASMMAALSVGAGNLGGGREIYESVRRWQCLGTEMSAWRDAVKSPMSQSREDVWLPLEHFPGFDPNGGSCPQPVRQLLSILATGQQNSRVAWLEKNREWIEKEIGYPLAMSGVAGAVFSDLEFSADQAEMLFLIMRLPGAAVHALEQKDYGWRKYPFFGDSLEPMSNPEYREFLNQQEAGEP